MSGLQEKITRYAKRHEEKNQSVEVDPEMTEVTELVHKDVTTAVILPMYKKVDERMLCKISVILGRQLMLEL